MQRIALAASFFATSQGAPIEEFTIYTDPISLHPGQVHNHPVKPMPLPDWVVSKYKGKKMAVVKFDLDIVAKNEDGEVSVPLSEIYNHHTIQLMGTNAVTSELYKQWKHADPLGPPPQPHEEHHAHAAGKHLPHCGSRLSSVHMEGNKFVSKIGDHMNIWEGTIGGAEYRNAERDLAEPYRQLVDSPESLVAILHFINIKDGPYSPKDWPRLYECPCTSARKFDIANGTIDGNKPLPFACTDELLHQKNPDCKLEWYKGGYRCCEHLDFVTEKDTTNEAKRVVYGKFTLRITDETPDTRVVTIGTFDVTGSNAEYSIPACDVSQGTERKADCVHVATNRQQIGEKLGISPEVMKACPNGYSELLTARGHQHVAALGMELIDDNTGEVLCASKPKHEGGFIVGIPPCVWGPSPLRPPPKMHWKDYVGITSRYNSTETHHGVMGFWFLQASHSCGSNASTVLV